MTGEVTLRGETRPDGRLVVTWTSDGFATADQLVTSGHLELEVGEGAPVYLVALGHRVEGSGEDSTTASVRKLILDGVRDAYT